LPFTQRKWSFATMALSMIFTLKVKVRERTCLQQRTILSIADSRIENSYNGVEEAIERVVTSIRNTYGYSSLTFLLSDGAKLCAYRNYSQVKSEDCYGLFIQMLRRCCLPKS